MALSSIREHEQQRDLILTAPSIDGWCFRDLEVEELQLIALDKMSVNIGAYPGGPLHLKGELMRYATSSIVEDKINTLFNRFCEAENEGGPFSYFSSERAGELLSSTPEPKQQLEVIRAATYFDYTYFNSIGSENAQLLAIDKIALKPEDLTPLMKEYLREHAVSNNVEYSIEALFR